MSTLILPISPLIRSKSRLKNYFSENQLKDFTISMFLDLGKKLSEIKCFENILIYSSDNEILELALDYGLIGIREKFKSKYKLFDKTIQEINTVAIKKYNANKTILIFLDLILITKKNLVDINNLLYKNQIVVCPAINSAGISILGRNPPNIIHTHFSDPNIPSFFALSNEIKKNNWEKYAIYDSFRAGFDIDIKQDLVLGYEYLKILNLEESNTFKFLKKNLKLNLIKGDKNNNRNLIIIEKDNKLFKKKLLY
ncbi:MAG: hypothetical protein JXA99_07640 [Candidatus Lokiarchaeota archaeon]|nr:hypothetical protein [Candidatus Lokiarchaeota archaeon]